MLPYDVEWLNQNHFRAYPLRENASRKSSDGYVLPNEVLLDLVFLSFPNSKLPLYVKQITMAGDLFEIRIADSLGTIVTSVVVNISLHVDPQAYYVTGLNEYKNIRGHVILGDLSKAAQAGVGTHVFEPETASLLDTCVLPATPRVETLAGLGADGSSSVQLLGQVALKEGTNIRIKSVPEDNALQIDAIEGINPDCGCNDPFCGFEKPISRINGIGADDGCNINLRGIACINVRTEGNSIVIEDLCTRPGCGDCASLQEILGRLEALENFCANNGAPSEGEEGFDARPHIYETGRPNPKIICEENWLPEKTIISSQDYPQADPSQCNGGVLQTTLLQQHNLTDAQIIANGFYPIRDGDPVDLIFKVRNDTLQIPRGFVCADILGSLATAGLSMAGCTTEELHITGNIDFSAPFFQGASIKTSGAWGFSFLYSSPPSDPYDNPAGGNILLKHGLYFILRGFEDFPVGTP